MRVSGSEESAALQHLEIVRKIYANNQQWYSVAEQKAQLLLTIDGAFLAIVLSGLSVAGSQNSKLTDGFGPETWFFAALALFFIGASILCSALSMWSLHGRGTLMSMKNAGLVLDDQSTYKPEWLWYFGQLARLDTLLAAQRIQSLTANEELPMLAWHTADFAKKILRKFRYVNAGWALTASTLICSAIVILSLIVRSQ